MPSPLSQKLMNAYMAGTPEDIAAVKAEVEAAQKARIAPKKSNVVKLNTVLNDENVSPIKVYEFLNQALGPDWFTWEQETIEQILFIRYGVALEDVNRDKVFAIRHLCNSDGAFFDWFEFNQIALAFGSAIADFEAVRAPSPGMVISAVKVMNYIRPDRESFFSDEVLKYICILLINEGIYIPPPSLLFLIKKHMMKMVSEDTKKGWVPILKRYNEIVSQKDTTIKEEPVDIQAKRLVNAEAAALTYSE